MIYEDGINHWTPEKRIVEAYDLTGVGRASNPSLSNRPMNRNKMCIREFCYIIPQNAPRVKRQVNRRIKSQSIPDLRRALYVQRAHATPSSMAVHRT